MGESAAAGVTGFEPGDVSVVWCVQAERVRNVGINVAVGVVDAEFSLEVCDGGLGTGAVLTVDGEGGAAVYSVRSGDR